MLICQLPILASNNSSVDCLSSCGSDSCTYITSSCDTIIKTFYNDTINLEKPYTVGQIIYAEHIKYADILKDYIFPIIMLLIGIAIDRLIMYLTLKTRIAKAGQRWSLEITSLKKPIIAQQKEFRTFIQEYCDDSMRFDIPTITHQNLLGCEIFDALSKNDLYDFLLSKHKREEIAISEYHSIIQIISSIKSCNNTLNDALTAMRSEANKQMENFNIATREYFNVLTKVMHNKTISDTAGTNLYNLYQQEVSGKMPYVNIYELEGSLIKPSCDILSKLDNGNNLELFRHLCSISDTIQALRNEKIYIKQNLEKLIICYDGILNKISEIKFEK
jgi:hypothetical protein